MELWIKAGAILHFAVFLFHLGFAKLFRWETQLPKLSFTNRNIMQLMNLSIALICLLAGLLSWFYASELLNTELGRVITAGIAFFWAMRALGQLLFFKFRYWQSLTFFGIVLGGSFLYAWPLLQTA